MFYSKKKFVILYNLLKCNMERNKKLNSQKAVFIEKGEINKWLAEQLGCT